MTDYVTVGGNLQQIALAQYGDATMFVQIMQDNGLADYLLTGQQTLQLSSAPAISADGLPQT